MKIVSILTIALVSFNALGCSMPTAAVERPLYSITKEVKATKSGFMGSRKSVTIRDFRGNDVYEEEITALKEEAEKYISSHPDLSEEAKNNLREIKVTQGSTAGEVALLLGEPDKVSRAAGSGRYGASEIWIYRISKIRAFTVFIFPVFFVHEGYYLYFKDGALVEIERHYLKQVIMQGAGGGVTQVK